MKPTKAQLFILVRMIANLWYREQNKDGGKE